MAWAADAAAYDIILMISSVVLSSVAELLLKRKIEQLRERLSNKSAPFEPLTRDRAIERSKSQVVMSYNVKRKELEVESDEEDRQRNTWTIELRASNGGRYIVEIGSVGGYASTYRIKRETG